MHARMHVCMYACMYSFILYVLSTFKGSHSADSYLMSMKPPSRRLFSHLIDTLILSICSLVPLLLFVLKHLHSHLLEVFSDLVWQL